MTAPVQPATAEELLPLLSGEGLLDVLIQLTHRIHGADRNGTHTDDLRAQRNLVRAEVLRRMGSTE